MLRNTKYRHLHTNRQATTKPPIDQVHCYKHFHAAHIMSLLGVKFLKLSSLMLDCKGTKRGGIGKMMSLLPHMF